MKISALLASLAPTVAFAHYTFPIMANGTSAPAPNANNEWQYVRMTTNHYSSAPVDDINSPQMRCYEDQTRKAATVMPVAAGSSISFRASNTMGHPGPVLMYMARVPAGRSADGWDGSGQVWFKIHEEGATIVGGNMVQFRTGMTSVAAWIPQSLPAGEYLVRVEHIALHKPGSPQHYIACGQVRVSGSGSGRPGPLVAFPGAYRSSDPGLTFNMYSGPAKPYPIPGPAVWKG